MFSESEVLRGYNSCTREMDEITIRNYVETDLPGVLEVERECFEPGSRYPRYVFEYLARSGAIFKVATRGNLVVGYAIASLEGDLCHVISIGVRRNYRRKGIGLRLMCEILLECTRHSASIVYLEVDVGNEPAIKLYEKLGFCILRTLKDYYGPGKDAYLMWKTLS